MRSADPPAGPRRLTYLLSLWQEGSSWRAALRPAEGGPRLGFGDLEQLVAFLLRLQDDPNPAAPPLLGPARETESVPAALSEMPSVTSTDDEQQR